MKLVKHLANLGYGSRKEVAQMFRAGRITDARGEVLYADDQPAHADIRAMSFPFLAIPKKAININSIAKMLQNKLLVCFLKTQIKRSFIQ